MNANTITQPAVPTIQPLAEATRYDMLGGSIIIQLRADQTGGRLGLLEQVIPAGYPGPALHIHPDFDETFIMLEGTLAFCAGGKAYDADAGSAVFVPRGTPHTFANRSSGAARCLVLVTPGGFERYFEELAFAFMRAGGLPDPDELTALGIAHGSLPVGHPQDGVELAQQTDSSGAARR
jgi:mannose-6-phosphate isomerase-like protein (cupin superfamily)